MNANRTASSTRVRARLLGFVAALALVPATFTGCASVEGEGHLKPGWDYLTLSSMAVVDGKDKSYVDETRQAILDTFQMHFFKKGWPVIERSNIDRAVDELNFQNADFTQAENRRALGNFLNVDALLIVNLADSGDEVSMTAKLVEVDTGTILWMGTGEGELSKGLGAVTGAVVGAAVGAAAGGDGDIVAIGGAIGGATGYMLGPTELKGAKNVVEAICDNLPAFL